MSLTEALEEIAAAWRASGGGDVRFNFGGSNSLARQIAAGAPVDLFISADEAQMRVAEAAGAIDASTRVPLLSNRLVIVVRRGGASVREVRDLARRSIRRIAIGDPAAVPAGVYARQYLEAVGLWRTLEPKFVPVGNVRAALAAAAGGSVDAAFTYESDADASREVEVALVVAGAHAPVITYPAAITIASKRRAAAERFLAYLRGPEASAIFLRHHFTPLAGAR